MRTFAGFSSVALLLAACVGDTTTTPIDASTDTTADTSTKDTGTVDAPADNTVVDAGPPFPATLSNVVVWLDAQETSTLHVTGGKVTKWDDRTNFQHDAVAVTSFEPTTGTDVAHNVPIVKFSNADMILANTIDATMQLGTTDDFLVEIVMLNTTNGEVVFHDMSTSTPKDGLMIGIIGGEDKLAFGLNYAGPFVRDTVSSTDGKLRLFGFQRTGSGGTLSVRDNGVQTATTSVTPADVSAVVSVHLGAFDATASNKQFMSGAVGELIVVHGPITQPDESALEQYLMTKWHLP